MLSGVLIGTPACLHLELGVTETVSLYCKRKIFVDIALIITIDSTIKELTRYYIS